MPGISALHGNVDPLGHTVLAAENIDDLGCRKRTNWIIVVWKNVLAGFDVIVTRLVEEHNIAVKLGKKIADKSCREVSAQRRDLVKPI